MWDGSGIFATSSDGVILYVWSMILSENRFPLFANAALRVRIMLSSATALAYESPNGHDCFGNRRPGASFPCSR